MRYLILSDIHANLQALEAALASAEGKYDEAVCLGDVAGYGADPCAVIEWTRKHVKQIVRGNHDKACAGLDDLEWFNPVAKASALWTRGLLPPADAAYLRELPRGPQRIGDFDILHGSPADEDEYLITLQDAAFAAPHVRAKVSFFGHTHVQGGFLLHRNGIKRLGRMKSDAASLELTLEPDSGYLVNPGSVGQPRDGDPRAAYAIYAPGERLVTYCRVPYDVAGAQKKIRAAGLPPLLADRLAEGV